MIPLEKPGGTQLGDVTGRFSAEPVLPTQVRARNVPEVVKGPGTVGGVPGPTMSSSIWAESDQFDPCSSRSRVRDRPGGNLAKLAPRLRHRVGRTSDMVAGGRAGGSLPLSRPAPLIKPGDGVTFRLLKNKTGQGGPIEGFQSSCQAAVRRPWQ